MADEELEQEQKSGSGLIKWIILAVLLILLGGGGYFAYVKFFSAPKEAAKTAEETKAAPEEAGAPGKKDAPPPPGTEGQVIHLPPFVVNLNDPQGRRYLKLAIDVEVANQDAAALLTREDYKVKDTILLLLSSKTYQELSSMESKILLKKEIVDRLNLVLGGPKILRVYFTEMVVQ